MDGFRYISTDTDIHGMVQRHSPIEMIEMSWLFLEVYSREGGWCSKCAAYVVNAPPILGQLVQEGDMGSSQGSTFHTAPSVLPKRFRIPNGRKFT
jgi:hypothetical protein